MAPRSEEQHNSLPNQATRRSSSAEHQHSLESSQAIQRRINGLPSIEECPMTTRLIPEASPSGASLSPKRLRRSRNNSGAGSVTSASSHVTGSNVHSYSNSPPLQNEDYETNDHDNAERDECVGERSKSIFRETMPVAFKQLKVIDISDLWKGLGLMFWVLGGVYVALCAFYKIVLVFTVAFLAIGFRKKHVDFHWQVRSEPGFKPFDSVSGFIYIVYSYSGWENANYVIGELKAKPRTLRLGAFTALTLVTTGYPLLVLGYYLACSTIDIENSQDLGMAIILAPTFRFGGAKYGLQVCIALSAFGNLIADVYTSCRVKQAIALHNFIPFAKFFAADSESFGTPGGALILH
ncbi:uncharacterized protein PAC_12563 [Phialocephala subalpina]|uniref:Uncharacterized protein n=1 Tax=Phialocephala subalpina TaxID=576137 RepID=A0A1L7XCE2_9HELO|nr:uncharacterized protein PAC_12563 [Phialocephala subalpina]